MHITLRRDFCDVFAGMALTVASAILLVALLMTLALYFHRRSARRKVILHKSR